MEVTDLGTYLILSYFSHTAAVITSQLIPLKDPQKAKLLREWLSSAYGVTIGFSTGVNLLSDVGINIIWAPAGYLITGILLGQGVKFGLGVVQQIANVRRPTAK